MNSFTLKVLACTFMLIDHIGAALLPQYVFLRVIGRLAFPIFAWMLTIGYKHTKDPIAYMKRLAFFALISQLPFYLAFNITHLNIFFTLLLGFVSIYACNKIENPNLKLLPLIALSILAVILKTDYDFYGVFTIFFFYLFRDDFKKTVLVQCAFNLIPVLLTALSFLLQHKVMPLDYALQSFSLFSLILIYLYNGEQGRKAKYFFYIFYPAHLTLIYLIKVLLRV